MLENGNYTEEEKRVLFEKLKKIGQLFGLQLSIEEHPRENSASCITTEGKVKIGLRYTEFDQNVGLPTTTINKLDMEVIDKYHTDFQSKDYIDSPQLLRYFLHECSHLLTITGKYDETLYRKHMWERRENSSGCDIEESVKSYFNLPYEKLANNLAYELLYQNHNQIIEILLGVEVRIDSERVQKNIETSKQFKEIYIMQ